MSREENVALTRQGFEAFQRGDGEWILRMADPEVQVFGTSDWVNGGLYFGHEGYVQWLGQWLEAWDDFSVEILETRAAGERHVITSVRQTAVGRGSGIPVEMGGAFLTEIRDGRIRALHLYAEAETARAVAERRESGEPDAHGD